MPHNLTRILRLFIGPKFELLTQRLILIIPSQWKSFSTGSRLYHDWSGNWSLANLSSLVKSGSIFDWINVFVSERVFCSDKLFSRAAYISFIWASISFSFWSDWHNSISAFTFILMSSNLLISSLSQINSPTILFNSVIYNFKFIKKSR